MSLVYAIVEGVVAGSVGALATLLGLAAIARRTIERRRRRGSDE